MFKRKGVINVDLKAADEDRLIEIALDAGADDVSTEADGYLIVTPPESYAAVRDAMEKAKVPIAHSELGLTPENMVKVSGHTAEQVLK